MHTTVLGKLITKEEQRDAIHIAVAPVFSNIILKPGERIALVKGSTLQVTKEGEHIGIVDPFLKNPVKPNQWFYMLLFPQTITSLKHEWTHPAFEKQEPRTDQKSESEKWIRDFADEVGLGYETLLDGAKSWIDYGDYLILGGLLEGHYVPEEFWGHYEIVMGIKVPGEKQGSFFSCSC